MPVLRLTAWVSLGAAWGLGALPAAAESMCEAALLPTQAEVQFLRSWSLGKFTVETDTLLKVLLRPGVTAGRAGSEDYSGAACRAHCPPKHE